MQVPILSFALALAAGVAALENVGTTINSHLSRRQTAQSDSDIYDTRFDGVTWDNKNWQLTTTTLDQGHYQARMTVANGYIGINVAALGPFFEVDVPVDGDNIAGWPLFDRRQAFATIAGFWDSQPTINSTNFDWLIQYGWESVISGVPHWAGIVVDLGGDSYLDATTNASQIQDFTSMLDMKSGVLNWAYTWSPSGSTTFNISYQMFAHKLEVNKAFVQLNVTAKEDVNVTIASVLNGDCALRTIPDDKGLQNGLLYSSVHPDGLQNITGVVYTLLTVSGAETNGSQQELSRPYVGGNESSIAAGTDLSLRAGQTVTVTKYVGIASSDGYEDPRGVARNAVMSANSTGYTNSLASHAAEWASILTEESVDDFSDPTNGTLPDDPYAVESAILAVANPYYLLQNTLSENAVNAAGSNTSINKYSIPVGGLGSDSYAGQIFWDAETWMQPGLVAAFPYAARGISNYRVDHYEQAQQNIKTAYQSSKNETDFSTDGAIFPWTSARPGNCTAVGPCWDYEYHINGDIATAFMNEWVVSGDTDFFKTNYFPVQDSIALTLSELLVKNGSNWSLTNMTDPDEFANHIDNGGFTMSLISNILNHTNYFRSLFDSAPNATWSEQAEHVLISRNQEADILLEYTGMNGSIDVKQADVVLVTYPASFTTNYTETNSLSDLDYYAAKQSQDGPGMTYAIFSIVANQVSPSGCSAYTYSVYSHHPYVRAPWFQFSEQLVDEFSVTGYHPAFPFLTGHGGANQVVLFGYLGLRLLPTSPALHINPSLPPQVPQIRYRTFYWQGWPIQAISNQTHTTLTRSSSGLNASGTSPNTTYADSPIPVIVGPPGSSSNTSTYSLPANGTLTIPNRQYAENKTTPGNVLQCQAPVSSTNTAQDDFVPGQFPEAAIDGATSTKWQPKYANKTASLTVRIPAADQGKQVLGVRFDWGQAPAFNYSVSFSNSTSSSASQIVAKGNITVSDPYSPSSESAITSPRSNTTFVDFMGNASSSSGEGGPVGLGPMFLTAEYATLTIWGSLSNGTYGVEDMQGEGATVAEWEVIVAEEGDRGGVPAMLAKRDGGKAVEMGLFERELLGRVGRYERGAARWREKRGEGSGM